MLLHYIILFHIILTANFSFFFYDQVVLQRCRTLILSAGHSNPLIFRGGRGPVGLKSTQITVLVYQILHTWLNIHFFTKYDLLWTFLENIFNHLENLWQKEKRGNLEEELIRLMRLIRKEQNTERNSDDQVIPAQQKNLAPLWPLP